MTDEERGGGLAGDQAAPGAQRGDDAGFIAAGMFGAGERGIDPVRHAQLRAEYGFDKPVIVGHTDEWTAITRYGEVHIAHHDTLIQAGDHVIIFCTQKKLVRKVEKLFQVGFHFL